MPKKKEPTSLSDMLGLLQAGIGNKKPNNLQYEPYDKQELFHANNKPGRQLLGGNRSGKTVAGINEDIWWLTGRHPYLKLPEPPIIGRIVTVDFKNGVNKIILPQLRQWLVPSDLINGSWEDSWNGNLHTLTLNNDSEVEIMSHEQELDKFAGVPRHFIHFDEEPPKDIFGECLARLTDYNGRWWLTMTPVDGITWTYEDIYEKAGPLIEVIEVASWENPNLNKQGLLTTLEGYSEDEMEIRGKGKYVAISGLVFKEFQEKRDTLVIKTLSENVTPVAETLGGSIFYRVPDPNQYTHYVSLDQGFNNPTAINFHAVHKETSNVITYAEHYKREMTVQQHAEALLAYEEFLRDTYGIIIFLHIADPAIKQRQQSTGLSIQIEYAQNGVNWATGRERDINAGLDKMNNYIRLDKWFILENCVNGLKEMRKYRRADFATARLREKNNKKETPMKKDDHWIDSCRYFFSFMPDFNPKTEKVTEWRPNLMDAPVRRVRNFAIDPNLVNDKPQFVVDEYVGEW